MRATVPLREKFIRGRLDGPMARFVWVPVPMDISSEPPTIAPDIVF